MSMGMMGTRRTETAPLDSERHLRSDARRNRDHVLEAAGTLMATQGVDVSIDEIAELAHVGVGTVYRNFPTKGALLEALLLSRLEPLVAAAHAAAGSDDPGAAFVNFVRKLSEDMCDFKALADAMCEAGVDVDRAKEAVSSKLMAAVGALLEEAQAAGRVRPDVNIVDVAAMMMGLGHADPSLMTPAQRSRCVALVCDSLLIDARSVLPQRLAGSQ